MYKYVIIFLFVFYSCKGNRLCFLHSSPLIENAILNGKEIKIYAVTSGDVYDDPIEHYEVSIIKMDSLYLSTCLYRGKEIKRVLTKEGLLQLSDFEKKILKERNRQGLCNIYASVYVEGRYNNFNIDCSEKNEFDSLLERTVYTSPK